MAAATATGGYDDDDRRASSRVIRLAAGGDVKYGAGGPAGTPVHVGCLRHGALHPAGGLQRRAAWAMGYFLGKIFER